MDEYAKPLEIINNQPALLENEIISFSQPNVGFYISNERSIDYDQGTVCITPIRLLWFNTIIGLQIELKRVSLISSSAAFLGRSAKIHLMVKPIEYLEHWICEICSTRNDEIKCSNCGIILSKPSYFSTSTHDLDLKLSLRGGGLSESLKALNMALDGKQWQVQASSRVVGGVSGLLQSIQLTNENKSKQMEDAFADLDSLMSNVVDMVKLAESLNSKMGNEPAVLSYLHDLGISQPVTKKGASNNYHQELAKELCVFITNLFKKQNINMISLADLYCYFNRARGVELISPDDLLRAANELETMQLPFRLYEFQESGLLVVQTLDYDVDRVAESILAHIQQGTTAIQLASKLKISIALAQEHLRVFSSNCEMMESNGLACRDETIHGLYFYPNLFLAEST